MFGEVEELASCKADLLLLKILSSKQLFETQIGMDLTVYVTHLFLFKADINHCVESLSILE